MPNLATRPTKSWVDDVQPNIKAELKSRNDELSRLQEEQEQKGTSVPQLYGTLSRFIANPSTVSVETYKRMLDTDETIGSGIDFLNLALIARFGEYKHPIPAIEKFVRRALSQMEGSWHENLDEMLSAEWAGFSVTEQVWQFVRDFDGAPAFVPKKLVTYQPLTLVFAVDRHGDILPDGIYQYQRYHSTFFSTFSHGFSHGFDNVGLDGFRPDLNASVGDYPYPIRIAADLTYLTVKIPKEKVIHLRSSSTGKFNNPYGRSLLRRIYKNWVMKDAFLKMWLVAADRKGTPLVVGYAAPNDSVQDAAGMPIRADQALANIMSTIHNSSFIVLPGRKTETYEVDSIQVQGDMNVFKDGIDYFNKAIMRGLLIPPLMMSGGDGGGSYAMADVHKALLHQIIDGKNKVYQQGIIDQFIKKLIAYNFPRAQWEKEGPGSFSQEETDPELMEKLANVFNVLTTAGYMTPEAQQDMDFVRGKMNMEKSFARPQPAAIDPFQDDNEANGSEDDSAGDVKKKTQGGGEDPLPPNYKV